MTKHISEVRAMDMTTNSPTCKAPALETPLGPLWITASSAGLTAVSFDPLPTAKSDDDPVLVARAAEQLAQYFAGEREQFDLPLAAQGTAFQHSVWRALTTLGFGEMVSYRHIAEKINNEKAVRAVGAANGRNPIAIIVPCHRVIGANGTLTGYAGGLDRKQWLLAHEQRGADLFS